ncbi:MAG: type II toxin-antitoxin system VapC family toxin [Deltaproteobacteria bacterium]|nr:type II toxin-antitoxin system VapC family toxin [Deltaproteobacteria bacterium]
MIVLDTHAWIWWVSDPQRLSDEARYKIQHANAIGICPISCWEMATKVSRGKLQLDRDIRDWVRQALAIPKMRLLALSEDIAITAGQLGQQGFHGDPADRLIVATALHHGAGLVSKDEQIRAFSPVQAIW